MRQIQNRVINHGRILSCPDRQPKNTQFSVAYELGKCFQLDKNHCLLTASMDEQGGGDKCVGNHGFIFKKLDDIAPENYIELNWPELNYQLKGGTGSAFLAKFPVAGGFVPLGAKLTDGKPYPGEGTGILVSFAMTFNSEGSSADESSEFVIEVIQIKWDGKELKVTSRKLLDTILDFRFNSNKVGRFSCGESLFYL